jgi:hypothetical protein
MSLKLISTEKSEIEGIGESHRLILFLSANQMQIGNPWNSDMCSGNEDHSRKTGSSQWLVYDQE